MHQWVRTLEELRVARGFSKNQLQERGIITRSQYNTLLKAKKGPRFDILERILKGIGVTWQQWADVYEGAAFDEQAYAKIPLYEVKVAAGAGAIIESERVIQDIAFRRDWIKTKLRANLKDLGCLSVTGHSMEPTIHPGDLVMFDRSQHAPKHDQIFAIRNDGEPLVKRLCLKNDGLIEIHSDNPDPNLKRPWVKRDALDIIGRVVWVAGKRS